MKNKIAIAIDNALLKQIDGTVDGVAVRSRSQAIEMLVRTGMESKTVDTAAILLSKKHHGIAKRPFRQSFLLNEQAAFFSIYGIRNMYVVTQNGDELEVPEGVIRLPTNAAGSAGSLKALKGKIRRDFVVMSGDTYNSFDLSKMVKSHVSHGKIATIGLMSHKRPSAHGIVRMDGDMVTEFVEKPKHPRSNIVNAGIYIFKPEVFEFIENSSESVEKNILPRLAKARQLVGHFTMGEYAHLDE